MCSNAEDLFEIIVGTYEQYLVGYKVQFLKGFHIKKSFATHSHLASVRTVANSKHYIASAGADETICLYDMRTRRESGKLTHHEDTINCVAFTPDGSHLVTCSKDGSISAVRCGNWQVEKIWPAAHRGKPVNTIGIHPTGMLALSTGEDGVLRTWNLIKGRHSYATNLIATLKSEEAKWATIVRWSPYGIKYLVAVNRSVCLYSLESARMNSRLTFNSKVICAEFLAFDLVAVGFENGEIKFYNLKSERTLTTKAHDMRVKCMSSINDLLVSASSSGEIKLWRYDTDGLLLLKTVNCGARITCLSLVNISKDVPKKKSKSKKKEENEEEEKVKKKSKLRLKQEVIIENEDESEVANIANPKEKASETKGNQKKKRNRSLNVEEIAEPTKKELLKPPETSPPKKRKEDSPVPQTTSPAKKIKKTDTKDDVQNSKKKIFKSKEIVQKIENEDESEVANIANPKEKASGTKGNQKKKRNRSLDVEEIAKQKKKLPKPPETSPPKKRKDSSTPQTTSPAKKTKKTDEVEESSLARKRHVIIFPPTDAPFKKVKRKAKGKVNVPKKKKKKSMK